jgi:hypothetical protein
LVSSLSWLHAETSNNNTGHNNRGTMGIGMATGLCVNARPDSIFSWHCQSVTKK